MPVVKITIEPITDTTKLTGIINPTAISKTGGVSYDATRPWVFSFPYRGNGDPVNFIRLINLIDLLVRNADTDSEELLGPNDDSLQDIINAN